MTILKWAGGKRKLIKEIQSALPAPSETTGLIEPCVGGANVFMGTEYRSYILADVNADLIRMYTIARDEPEELINVLAVLWENNTEKDYYEYRSAFNTETNPYLKSALFVYLNRHGYNGLCRYNSKGGFNSPYGFYKKPYLPADEIRLFSEKSQTSLFVYGDFECVMRAASPGVAIYVDPPYVPLTVTSSFTGYAEGGFSMADQDRLARLAEELSSEGVHVAISNIDTAVTRELYKGATRFVTFDVQRNIAADGAKRSKVRELIAVYEGR